MQKEIDDLKKQLFDRTGQLEAASITILERNDEIQKLKQELDGHLQYISELESKIKQLEDTIENSKLSGAESESKLRQEIQRLLQDIENLKAQHKKEFEDMLARMRKEKDDELKLQAAKFEKQVEGVRAQAKKDLEF